MSGAALRVAIAGNHAYMANGTNGLQLIDVSNPAAPQLAGRQPTTNSVGDVGLSGNHAFVTETTHDGPIGGRWLLSVIDISDSTNPKKIGSVDLDDYPCSQPRLAVAGDFLYVAGGGQGLLVFAIRDPANPRQVGYLDIVSFAVAVSGNWRTWQIHFVHS